MISSCIMMSLVVICLCTILAVHANDLIVRDKDDESGASSKPTKAVKMFNFASQSAGAVIIDKSPATAKGYHYLLNDDKDKYGISACEEKKWVVIGLSEDILITSVEVSNYEKYSSMLKDFQLLASNSYPTDEWINLGKYTARPQLGSQTFNVTDLSASHTRYLKVKFLTHYSDEALCTLSQIKVYGMTVIASFQQEVQRSDHHTRDVLNHLTAEEGVNFREIMETSLREEALHAEQAHHEHHQQPTPPVPVETAVPLTEPAVHSADPVAPSPADQVCPDSNSECTTESCPTLEAPVKEAENRVAETIQVVDKLSEGVCAAEEVTTSDAASPTVNLSVANTSTSVNQTDSDVINDGGEISYTVSVDGGGVWVEPQHVVAVPETGAPVHIDTPLTVQTHTPAQQNEAITSVHSAEETHHSVADAETSETEKSTAEASNKTPAPVFVTDGHAPEKSSDRPHEETSTGAEGAPTNTCEENTASDENNTAEAAATKPRPFAEKVLKQLLEFNLFATPETTEVAEETRDCTEPVEEHVSKNATVVPPVSPNNSSASNSSHSLHRNATKTDNETSRAHVVPQGGTNDTHVVSNVSLFVANGTGRVDKPHHRAEPGTVHFPLIGNVTPNASAHAPGSLVQENNATKANTTHVEGGVNAAIAHTSNNGTTNASADVHATAHKPAVLNTTHERPVPSSSNKTEHSTVQSAVPVKTANSSSTSTSTSPSPSTSTPSSHNSTNTNGSALNCFETLSFAKFSEKMRLKLQQKSVTSGGGVNGSHNGSDSAVVAEAAALAAAAGASAKDNNVFRSLMQKIKTLEVDNAIVEMYTIQLSDCYKTVTKELLSRTQVAPDGSKKHKFSTEAVAHGSLAHTVKELEQLRRLAPQILFNYTEAQKLGVVDTFLVVLLQVVEENLVVIVLGSVVSLLMLFIALLVLGCVLLVSKRASPRRGDEH